MRSFDAKDKDDVAEAKHIGAEPWMLELLSLNPEYVLWGPGEDYMQAPEKDGGWASGIEIESWRAFDWKLDELNECVNFYFQVRRSSRECDCGGSGYNPATNRISEDFYDFANTGRKWNDKITQDEVDALVASGRLREHDGKKWVETKRTAAEVNAAQAGGPLGGLEHDAINRGILIETRAKRLGVWGLCEHCDGRGYVFTEPKAHASLVLWILHPRKGCSRGCTVMHLEREDIPKACAWLAEAAKRNAQRFAPVVKMAKAAKR